MNVQQGDHVCFSDPQGDPEYFPISQVRGAMASVFTGKIHKLVPVADLLEYTKVGSITYYQVTETTKVEPTQVQPDVMYRVDFRVDGWTRVKVVPAKSEKAARKKAIAQLALEMNRTISSLSAMCKRVPNQVLIQVVAH